MQGILMFNINIKLIFASSIKLCTFFIKNKKNRVIFICFLFFKMSCKSNVPVVLCFVVKMPFSSLIYFIADAAHF